MQPTVSRDIAQLGLVKVRARDGRLVYALPDASDLDRLAELSSALRRWALSLTPSMTSSSSRRHRGRERARPDDRRDARRADIVGTVAGDNTIIVVAREGCAARSWPRSAHHLEGESDEDSSARLLRRAGHELLIAWLKEDYGFDEVVAVLVDVEPGRGHGPSGARGGAPAPTTWSSSTGARHSRTSRWRRSWPTRCTRASIRSSPPSRGRSSPRRWRASRGPRRRGGGARVHRQGNDQVRFELAFKATYPGVRVIAPLRDHVWTRDEEIAYALARRIPVEAKQESPYSIDDNLFGRAIEAGVLEDPWAAPPEEAFELTAAPSEAPEPEEVVVSFEAGLPVPSTAASCRWPISSPS